MANPAFTQARYEAISAAYAEGVLEVQYEDRKVTYRSRKDMAGIIREMERHLGITSGAPKRTRIAHTKGLGPTTSDSWSK